jgi:hypothetical protein
VHISAIFETEEGKYEVRPGAGLGTVVDVNKRAILTHNHFGFDNPDYELEKALGLSITDGLGKRTQVNDFNLIPIDDGAMLIDLANDEITLNREARLGNSNDVSVGDAYTTVYWSGASIIKFDTVVKEIRSNVFALDNTNNIIRPGDSGGGGFVNNHLVGVTWSILESETFHASKLPNNLKFMINSETK